MEEHLCQIEIDNLNEKEKDSIKTNSLTPVNSSSNDNKNNSGITGIKNDLYDNNCYINVCIQSIYHFRLLRFNLLSTQQFPLFSNSPKIITELVLLISAYKQSLQNINILDPSKFCDALDQYFKDKKKFQKNQQNDPIELLNTLLIFIHTYIVSDFKEIGFNEDNCQNKCFIHQLFFLELKECLFCSNCKLTQQIKYDNNNFMFLINVNNIIETSNQYFKEFRNFKEKIIQCFNYGNKICSKCNSNQSSTNFICSHIGYYFIINLSWENKVCDLVILLKIICMINSGFSTVELFNNNIKKKIMKFLGLILFSSHHYVNLCYNKTDNNFILYDDTKIIEFPNWEKVIEYIIDNRYLPIAIFYETQNNSLENNCQFNISQSFYLQKYNECVERDKSYKKINKNNNKLIIKKLKDDEWECDNCNSINPPNNPICNCGYKNEIVERLFIQNLKNQNNYHDLNNNNKNNNRKIDNYKINNNKMINNLKINKEIENSNISSDDNPFALHTDSKTEYNGNPNKLKELSAILNFKNYLINNENEKSTIKTDWKCPVCKTMNKSDKNRCNNCGRRNNGNNLNYWVCQYCSFGKNELNIKKCKQCDKENNILHFQNKYMKKKFI